MLSQFVSLPDLVRSFAFPLNVYAWCLLRETGEVRSLHYGFFRDAEEPIDAAQTRSTDALFGLMPPPCKVLDVGIGVGATLNRLQAAGYSAHGITPDSAQVRAAKAIYGDRLSASVTTYESFDRQIGQWDLLLFQESGQYIDLLELFSKASALLQPSGTILLADEFALKRTQIHQENLHLLEHVISIGERFGFELITQIDVSRDAARTVDVLIRLLTKHQGSIVHDLGVQKDDVLELISANRRYQQIYAENQFVYYLMKFQRMRQPVAVPGWIRPQQFEDVRSLFKSAFGITLSPAVWSWKYDHGRGQAVGVWEDGRLVAHYGGLTRPILFFGQQCFASQSADVMTEQHARASLARRSPFFVAAATYLECTTGFGRHHLIGYGFPSVRARKAPELLGLYSGPVGKMLELAWPARDASFKKYCVRSRRLSLLDAGDAKLLEACWSQMKKSLSQYVVGVRDLAWFEYRYANHPENCYEIYSMHYIWRSDPLGIVVLRRHPDGRCEWVDAIARPEALGWLVHGIHRLLEKKPNATLFAWVSDSLLPLFSQNVSVIDLGIGIPANGWTNGPDVDRLANRWWLMGGDIDFR